MLTTDGKRIEMMSDREIKRRIGDALAHMPESPAADADFRALSAEREHRAHERAAATAHLRPAPAHPSAPDFSEIRGKSPAILDTIRAAVRSHLTGAPTVLLFNGAPGTGKTMLARRAPGILPALADHERAWIVAEYEGAGIPLSRYSYPRPFRAPHHTISEMALVGEGPRFSRAAGDPCPMCANAARQGRTLEPFHLYHTLPRGPVGRVGELELARHGVLFLDELIEFRLAALEALGRAWRRMAGRPLLVVATNPCPCGWADSGARDCSCSSAARTRYTERAGKAIAAIVGAECTDHVFAVDVPLLALADMRDGAPWPSTAEIGAAL